MDQPTISYRRGRSDPLRRAIFAFVAVAALAVACSVAGTAGTGPVESETRATQPFKKIEAGHGIGVSVRIGPTAAVEVRAQHALLPIIATDIDGDTLRIRGTKEFSASTAPQVVIVTPSLEGISLSGGSQGTVEGLTEAIGIELSGGAGLTASGTAEQVALQGSGGSVASLQDLAATTIVVDLSGGAIANLNASDEVLGEVSGGARAVVAGPARIDVAASGGGEVSHE
jgi:Putative auto-transporter adhesin, head GIN domain